MKDIKKVFLDTNVILDFLLKREPQSAATLQIFCYSESEKFDIFVSAISINNIYYIVNRLETSNSALKKVKQLLEFVEIIGVDKDVLEKAAYSDFKDFEDAIQNYSAASDEHSIIITRNVKDYKKSNLSILTPIEFITAYENV